MLIPHIYFLFFFFNDTATTEIYTFPYTTLFRSDNPNDDTVLTIKKRVDEVNVLFIATDKHGKFVRNLDEKDFSIRSEEHTSELQSRLHLVCRLLLEKKKMLYN